MFSFQGCRAGKTMQHTCRLRRSFCRLGARGPRRELLLGPPHSPQHPTAAGALAGIAMALVSGQTCAVQTALDATSGPARRSRTPRFSFEGNLFLKDSSSSSFTGQRDNTEVTGTERASRPHCQTFTIRADTQEVRSQSAVSLLQILSYRWRGEQTMLSEQQEADGRS